MQLSTAWALGAGMLVSLCAADVSARTWYIKPDGTGDAPTIQAGIDSASVGDVVLLQVGTYYERGLVMKSSIALRGEDEGGVVIDGGSYEWCEIMSCVGMGSATLIEEITFANGWAWESGGAMYLDQGSSLAIRHCTFTNCRGSGGYSPGAARGGAMHCEASSPTLMDCTFTWNTAGSEGEAHPSWGAGGGLYCRDSSPTIVGCTFAHNRLDSDIAVGAGACFQGGSALITDCAFLENVHGGGVSFQSCSATLDGCVLAGNSEGGLSSEGYETCTYRSCTFASNVGGHAILLMDGGVLSNIVICGTAGVAVACPGGPLELSCCDIIGNSGGDWVGCVAGQLGTNGNISEWPLFCNPGGGDYHVSSESPCLAENNGCGALIGALGQGCKVVGLPPKSWAEIKSPYR